MEQIVLFSFILFNSLSQNEVIASSVELFFLKPYRHGDSNLFLAEKPESYFLHFFLYNLTNKLIKEIGRRSSRDLRN